MSGRTGSGPYRTTCRTGIPSCHADPYNPVRFVVPVTGCSNAISTLVLMLLPARFLVAAVVLLASWQGFPLCTQASPFLAQDKLAKSPIPSSAVQRALLGSNGLNTTSHEALHLDRLFLLRFRNIIGNNTLTSKLHEILDVILDSPEQLRNTFSHAPSSAQLLSVSGSSAQRVTSVARALAATARGINNSASADLDLHAITGSLHQLADQLAQLSPGSCHPITRRVVLAALTLLQLRLHSDMPPPAAAQTAPHTSSSETITTTTTTIVHKLLFRIYLLLYEEHRRGAAAKGAIEFLHISKSGGTSMCSVADRNGCTTESTTNFGNCMVRRFDDRPRWVSAAVHNETAPLEGWRWYSRYLVPRGERSCEYRDEYMQRMGFTFYSNEFAAHGGLPPGPDQRPPASTGTAATASAAEVPAAAANSTTSDSNNSSSAGGFLAPPWSSTHLCPQFLNVVMLRHPLARLLSHIRWIIRVYRIAYGNAQGDSFFRGRDAAYWRRFAPAAVDNYYVRLLLGEAVFRGQLPGGINASHLAAARLVLLQYDVVLLLEAPDIDDLWLKHALGWRAGLSEAKARVGAAAMRGLAELVPREVEEGLMAGNGADVELYEFGAVVHQLDGLMFEAVEAAGIQPYSQYDSLQPGDERLGRRVRCGYVTRRKELLAGRRYNVTAYGRKYSKEFSRIPAEDERKQKL